MRAVVRQATADPAAALASARAHAAAFLFEGDAPLASASLLPKAIELYGPRKSEPVRAFWESDGIIAPTLSDALPAPEAKQRIQVTCAWGGIGSLWALRLARLEEARPVRACASCGRALTGRKKFCDATDDAACCAARRAEDKRRSRTPPTRKPRRG